MYCQILSVVSHIEHTYIQAKRQDLSFLVSGMKYAQTKCNDSFYQILSI